MKYSKEAFANILEELEIKYKYERAEDNDIYIFGLKDKEKTYYGAIWMFDGGGSFMLYMPTIRKYGKVDRSALLMVNKINAELKYGRIYLDDKNLSYRVNFEKEEITRHDVEKSLSELFYVIELVNDNEDR